MSRVIDRSATLELFEGDVAGTLFVRFRNAPDMVDTLSTAWRMRHINGKRLHHDQWDTVDMWVTSS